MPMSSAFEERLYPALAQIVSSFGTPFHIYDETGRRQTAAEVNATFTAVSKFKEYFTVKALPTPRILEIMREAGMGFDCSSISELVLSRNAGAHGHAMGFTYNGRLRPKEPPLRSDGSVELVRRKESLADPFATLEFEPEIVRPM